MRRIVRETVFGSSAIARFRGFSERMDRLDPADTLIVTKLDRLGHHAIAVSATVNLLVKMGLKVHCFALGGADLTSTSATMTMQFLGAVSQFERTQSGLMRSKS